MAPFQSEILKKKKFGTDAKKAPQPEPKQEAKQAGEEAEN